MNNPIKVAIKLRTSTIVERFSLNSLVMFFYLKYNFSDKIFKGIELFLGVQHNIFLNSIPFKINNERNIFYRLYPI